jgi:hypothetical protein
MTFDENAAKTALESDERFPSGPWTGFFLQPALPGRHWMELSLSFQQGNIRGEGRDWVGSFLVHGRYDTAEGKCWFTKRYVGKHDVAYLGYNEGRGIWGTWELVEPPWRGGFHIWPEGMNVGEELTHLAAVDLPADPIAITSDDLGVPMLEPAGVGIGESELSEPDTRPWN